VVQVDKDLGKITIKCIGESERNLLGRLMLYIKDLRKIVYSFVFGEEKQDT
jgi:hypothetical protein